MPPTRLYLFTLVVAGLLASGCSGGAESPDGPAADPLSSSAKLPSTTSPADGPGVAPVSTPSPTPSPAPSPPNSAAGSAVEPDGLYDGLFDDVQVPSYWQTPTFAATDLQRWGIRRYESDWITLYTDLPRRPELEELLTIFDAAVPQWQSYFSLSEQQLDGWHTNVYLMGDRSLFERVGILHGDVPPFLHGYQRDAEIWLNEQPSDYYRRHLLLHEGTHSIMQWGFRRDFPPWYTEGTAELLATHSWQDGQLQLRQLPSSREQSEYWGRIKAVQEDLAAGEGRQPLEIMYYDATAFLEVEPYAWSWALVAFLDADDASQDALRAMTTVSADDFNDQLIDRLQPHWPFLQHHWQHFVTRLDYGYDQQRERIERAPVAEVATGWLRCEISADRGWQSTGWRLEAGQEYELRAEGRFELAQQPQTWWSEPNGVTIRYHQGLPLGMLIGAIIHEDEAPSGPSPLARPDPVGHGLRTTADRPGTLFLRLNDHPAELSDNRGTVQVAIRRVGASPPGGATN